LEYQKNQVQQLPSFARQLQNEGLIREWNVSQTTLEEVFLKLVVNNKKNNPLLERSSVMKKSGIDEGDCDNASTNIEIECNNDENHELSSLVQDSKTTIEVVEEKETLDEGKSHQSLQQKIQSNAATTIKNSRENQIASNDESHEFLPLVEETTIEPDKTNVMASHDDNDNYDVQFKPSSLNQIKALSRKFWIIRKRNRVGTSLQFVIPLLLAIVMIIVQQFTPARGSTISCSPCRENDDCDELCTSMITSPDYWKAIFEGDKDDFGRGFEWPHLWSRILNSPKCNDFSDINSLVWVTPLGVNLFPTDGANFSVKEPSQVQNFTNYVNANAKYYYNLYFEENLPNYDYSSCSGRAYYIDDVTKPTAGNACEKKSKLREFANVGIDVNEISDRNDTQIRFNMSITYIPKKVRDLFCDGIDGAICPAGEYLDTIDLVPTHTNFYYPGILFATYNLLNSNYGLLELDMQYVKKDYFYYASVPWHEPILYAVTLGIALSIASVPVLCEIISEKENSYVFNLLLNGLDLRNYWITFYFYHATLYLLSAMIFCILVAWLRVLNEVNGFYIFLVILFYMFGQFSFTVLVSSIFKKPRLAGAVMMLLIVMISLTMSLILDSDVTILPLVLDVIPLVSFIRTVFLITINYNLKSVWYGNLIMLSSSLVYCLAGIYIHGSTGKAALMSNPLTSITTLVQQKLPLYTSSNAEAHLRESTAADELDIDVQTEAQRAKNIMPSETAVKLDGLSKIFQMKGFKTKNAVIDLTMAMDYGEIFGLLGPNGAGKTTAISMITGQLNPSQGQVFVGGYNTVEDRAKALKLLGIVPQFDVLYDDMTVQEHLEMYAQVKGVDLDQISGWSKYIAAKVSLQSPDLYTRQSKQLSGGMRRRLSIGIALLSHPSVLFLDEPTTG